MHQYERVRVMLTPAAAAVKVERVTSITKAVGPIAEAICLVDLAAIVVDDARAVTGHDAVVEAEKDPETAICSRGVVDGDVEGSVAGEPRDMALEPVLVPRVADVVNDDDAVRGHIVDELARQGDPVRGPAVGRPVVDQLHARLALAVLRRSGEYGMLPEDRG